MQRLHKQRSALFWRFFASYFVLFLIPVLAAIVFTNVFVVRLIAEDARQRNDIVMAHDSEQLDSSFSTLQTSMIHLLSDSNLKSFIPVADGSADNPQRYEPLHALMDRLNKLEAGDLVANAYLIFPRRDLVVDSETYGDPSYYFRYNYPIADAEREAIFPHLSGKKMMQFTKPYTVGASELYPNNAPSARSVVSAVMSYPFNSDDPAVYLVVDVDREALIKKLGHRASRVVGTAIVDADGDAVVQVGSVPLGADPAARGDSAVSSIPSRFDETWRYVSAVDMQALLKPARTIRFLSFALFAFFLALGATASYRLSRRLYAPILEIKTGLAANRAPEEASRRDGNDFDVIKRYSSRIISENDQLTRMVSGMAPMVREHFVAKLLTGEFPDVRSIEMCSAEIGFEYEPHAPRTVLCVEIQFYSGQREHRTETSRSLLLAEMKNAIAGSFSGMTVWIGQTKPNVVACVVHHGRSPGVVGAAEAADIIKRSLQPFDSCIKATIGIGTTVHAIEQLPGSYGHALAMLRFKHLVPGTEICGGDSSRGDRTSWECFLSVQEVNRMFNLCKSRDYDALLRSAFELLEAGTRVRADQVKLLCTDVLNTWIRAAERDRGDFSIAFYSEQFDRLSRCVTLEELRDAFRDIHARMFSADEPRDRSRQFAEILEYIHAHYAEDLSIERFAQQLNMSVGHFSRTFKEVVGEKYVEYIAKVRMSKAKQYLLETDLKIDEIAEKVGYWGRNSFIPIFRKYEGVTPAKYRMLYGAASS